MKRSNAYRTARRAGAKRRFVWTVENFQLRQVPASVFSYDFEKSSIFGTTVKLQATYALRFVIYRN